MRSPHDSAISIVLLSVLMGFSMPAAEAAQAAAPPPATKPKAQHIVVPAGTVLTVKTGQALGSKTSKTGQTFLATLAQPVSVGGRAALPAGSTVSGTVVTATEKGKIKGEGQLDLALTSISVGGHTYQIQTPVLSSTEKGKGKRTAATTGGGAAGGALIGGLAREAQDKAAYHSRTVRRAGEPHRGTLRHDGLCGDLHRTPGERTRCAEMERCGA